jgi:DNA adenine methylase
MYKNAKPFVKWAGGKSQLLNEIRKKYPEKIERYCEPFLGGGAVLLDVLANFQPDEILANDINSALINSYVQVRDNVEELIFALKKLQEKFWSADANERNEIFLQNRNRFNELKSENENFERALLFIFLNKTCFNGLYRVNRNGFFNVPIGSYKNPPICDEKNLRFVSTLLANVQLKCADYSECADFINEKTFVYIDPPYRPLNGTSSFTSYSENKFDDADQIELEKFVEKISAKGAKIIVSNSDPKNENKSDSFFDDLYANYKIERVFAKRMINSKGNGRSAINEILICN